MDNIINQAEDISLTFDDLKLLCNPSSIKIMLYQELHNIRDVKELFNMFDNIIILYRTEKNYGHYVALINHQNYIEFFDPYGTAPDYALGVAKESLRHMRGQVIPHITGLLQDAQDRYKIRVVYNDIKLQEFHEHVNTCGRWCATRIKLKHLNLRQFQRLFLGQKHKPDMIVTYLTYLGVNKDIESLI